MAQQAPINEAGAQTQTRTWAAPGYSPQAPTISADGVQLATAPRPLPTVPGYTIERELGHGGMGEVYLARDPDGHRFALKMIRADRVGTIYLERFLREKSALLDLYHPNVVRIYYAGKTDEGSPYFTMPYCERGTLADHMAAFQADSGNAVALMIKVAEAIHYLHEQGQIHRDLKPQNILLGDNNEPYVSDFGLVKDLDALLTDEAPADYVPVLSTDHGFSKAETRAHITAAERLTRTAGAIGTMPYMSPEQLLNRKEQIGPQSDIWALGVILYELLCGVRPFEAETPEIVSQMIRQHPPHRPGAIKPGVDPALERIVMKCLAKEPRERYGSVNELADSLAAWLGKHRPDRDSRRLGRGRFALAGVLIFGLLGFAAYQMIDRGRTKSHDELERIQDELRATGEVNLLANNRPRWYQWMGGEGGEFVSAKDAGDLFEFRIPQARLLEVARRVPIPSYRFIAEIQQQSAGGYMGVYVGRSDFVAAGQKHHCVFGIQFQKTHRYPDGTRKCLVSVSVHSCPDQAAEGMFFSTTVFDDVLPVPEDGWRRVVIEHAADFIVVSLDGTDIVRTTRSALLKKAADLGEGRPGFENVTPTFAPAEGIGLYGNEVQVSVRKMLLQRVRD